MDTCPFSVTGEDKEQVKKLTGMHAMESHAEKMAAMSDEDKAGMDTQMDSAITEATA